jgi:hypothetical protein
LLLLAVVLSTAAGCASGGRRNAVPSGTSQPDQFLYERGKEELARK